MNPPGTPASPSARTTQPVLGPMWRGTMWLALKFPLQVIIAFWSIPLVQHAIGPEANGAYVFAWGFGFIQILLEFGMAAALQQQVSSAWARNDRGAVGRLVASGTAFYLMIAAIQMIILLAIAYLGLPTRFQGESRRLIVGLLWIQAVSAPFFGLLTMASTVLQAARRYAVLPRLDMVIMVVRFAILVAGLTLGVDFLVIIAVQVAVLLGGTLLPAFWVLVRELHVLPLPAWPHPDDARALFRVGFFIFLMQLSVVLADKLDTTVLGYALPEAQPGPSITVYQNVSKPFFQIRQTCWTLAYLVVPAVASLAAARDQKSLDRIKYDGTRFLVGAILPVTLLAGIYAAEFLHLWVGPRYVPHAWLLQLFLVAALPMILAVPSQMAIGLGKVKVVSLSPLAGSLVNLPLSYYLTTRLGVAGVIWGTVLTTLISNLLVPGVHLFRVLDLRPKAFLLRTLGPPLAGALVLVPVSWICRGILPADPNGTTIVARSSPLLINLLVGTLAYVLGYLATPIGRNDLSLLVQQIREHSP